jgi:divinyl chlorophyllide a 8-vinyl-reductase
MAIGAKLLAITLICVLDEAFSLSTNWRGTTIIAGATGYIGKSVVRESVRQGYQTVALVRDLKKVQSPQGKRLYEEFFKDATIVECDVSDPVILAKVRFLSLRSIYNEKSQLILYCVNRRCRT